MDWKLKCMREYKEEDFLMLSGIQHFTFCRRQWALIHIEQQWEENLRTVEGNIMHERAHDGFSSEKRGNLIISRGMNIFSTSLGVSGTCDIVEFHQSEDGIPLKGRDGKYIPVPVEYKKGRAKEKDEDIMQLVAQAICLEEMLCCEVSKGYLYYGETRRRLEVEITEERKENVKNKFEEMHKLYERNYTPKVKPTKACNVCSLKNLCLPILMKKRSVEEYIQGAMQEVDT